MRALIVAAALMGLLLVAAERAGAHSVPIDAGPRWQSAILYGFVHTLATVVVAMLPFRTWLQIASGWSFVVAVVLFSGVQIGKIMLAGVSGGPTPLDSLSGLVPVGGVAFITGWLLMGLSAALARRRED